MDAGNQTAAVRFLHPTAANLGGIETNAPDFTPELLSGNNRPQLQLPFYCSDPIIRKDGVQRRAGRRFFASLCSLWCGCVRGGAALPPRPQVSSYVTTMGDLPTTSLTLSNWSVNRRPSHLPHNGRVYSKLRWKHLCLIYGTNSPLCPPPLLLRPHSSVWEQILLDLRPPDGRGALTSDQWRCAQQKPTVGVESGQ